MPTYRINCYSVVTVEVDAPTEAQARKLVHSDDAEHLRPAQGDAVALDADGISLPYPVALANISFRKVWTVAEAHDADGNQLPTTYQPTDGPVHELEAGYGLPEFCADDDCAITLFEGEGHCGSCADRRGEYGS